MDGDIFAARIRDAQNKCIKNCVPAFIGFLSIEQAAKADAILSNSGIKYMFYGGYPDAERRYLACLPDWCDSPDFPISAVTFTFNKAYALCHRDFLGAITSLGISRQAVGDILTDCGRAVAFLNAETAEFAVSQIEKVGRVGVSAALGFQPPLPQAGIKKEFSDTVSSLRLDCVVGSLCRLSRSAASELISYGQVSVNSFSAQKVTQKVKNGDRISVKGKGKFFIENADTLSKKGRIVLRYSKYV